MRRMIAACLIAVVSAGASGQGMLADVFAGKLVNPEVGVYAWYELTDSETGMRFFLRQAIVGEEKVKRKKGFWVETELTPQVGYPMIYKMLLTGPAYEKDSVHRVLLKEGNRPPQEVEVDPSAFSEGMHAEGARTSLGTEALTVGGESLTCEHYRVGEGGDATEVWLNDAVRPIGVVKMATPKGILQLQRFGKGGPDAVSAFERRMPQGEPKKQEVEVRVDGEPSKNFSGGGN